MNETTKRPLTVSICGNEILDADGEPYAYMRFKHCNCHCEPKPVFWYTRRAVHIVKCINMHGPLVDACEDLVSIKGKIPEFIGSVFVEVARDLARDALIGRGRLSYEL